MKENTERVVVEQKPKKKRGRPKKNSVSNTIVEAVVEEFKDENNKSNAEEVLQVTEITYNGKTYYLDINNNEIYDPETSELVGKKNNGIININ